ncbi:hypothetical protein Tco_1026470 [Tanacetum coccineum]
MVAYLKKPSRSEGFQEIVDFLNSSHIRYAYTKNPTIYVSLIEKFWQTATGDGSGHPSEPQPPPSAAQPTNEEPIPNVVSSSHQKTQTPRQALTKATELPQTSEPIPNVPDEAVYEEWDDRGISACGSPRSQESMGGFIAQTRSERVPIPPRDSPLPRVNTLGIDKGSMSHQELTVLCTTLS